ncbi:MAG: response regulator [Cypionkella sp.]
MRILAVDDDAFILELIPKIGAKVGCPDITTARSGAQALDLIETSSTPFDCLLLDINMPEMDGVQLCERIRSVEGYRDTPIIMLTAMNDMSYLDRAFRAGASDYTVKPFDIIEFGKRLQSAQARIEANASGAAGAVAGDAAALDRFGIQGRGLVPLAGVPALIEYPALQNYLTRLSGSALSGVYVMAVLADQPLEAEDSAQTEAPFEVLKQVALAIDTVLSPATYVMAYAGQGQFVLVANAARQPQAAAIESAIQDRLDVQTDAAGDTAPVLVTISAGSAVRPGVSRSQRARTAFETALNLAKDRAADKLGAGELGAGQTARLGPSGNR